ncbi:hypothetical protein BDR03DRAFT_599226 [Suillus americanus]|nr:hypothetical protein BDR03DRAFT_599226 [Suillus americanus]
MVGAYRGSVVYASLERMLGWDCKTMARPSSHQSRRCTNACGQSSTRRTVNCLGDWQTCRYSERTHRSLISGSFDSSIRTCSMGMTSSHQPISSSLQHATEVLSVSFLVVLATACGDRNAYTWDVSAILASTNFSTTSLYVSFS